MSRTAPLLLCLAFLLGCTGNESPGQRLQTAVTDYNQSIRWGNIGAAAVFIPAPIREEWAKKRRRLYDDIVILDYEIVEVRHPDMQSLGAEVTVSMEWRAKNSNSVEKTVLAQSWKYDDLAKVWMMDKQIKVEKAAPEDTEEPIEDRL